MEFTNTFFVPLPLDDAWALLLDVPRILPCLPGAKLLETLGDDKYKGSVAVRLGPVALSFTGEAQLVKKDVATHTAWLSGRGVDPKGRGGAQSEFSFTLTPAQDGTRVEVHTDLQLSGSVAQYGRGSGMIADVAAQILAQFEKNLAKSFGRDGSAATAASAPATPAAAAPPGQGAAAEPPAAPVDTAPAAELNMARIGLKILWIRFLRLFGLRARS